MLFHSLDYILFLAISVSVFWLLSEQGGSQALRRVAHGLRTAPRVFWLFVVSCLFYMGWSRVYIVLILGSTVLDYVAGLMIHRADSKRGKRAWLAASLTGNLGLLFAFKYHNFFAIELSEIFASWGWDLVIPRMEDVLPTGMGYVLPVGISFYTFQTLSYTIDIYRGKLEPTKDFFRFGAFVTFFPQLVAGPIVRASELLPQLAARAKVDVERLSRGLFLIVLGLFKKLAIADFLALSLVDRVFDQPEMYSGAEVVIALYAFTMQLYCDFSGYTDVARGSAMLMGFELPENFDRPYQSTNPAEFWRRWHMTLSRWLRDYLYFPLGGSRCGPVRAYFNLGLTMFLVGIWHGYWANFEVFFWYALLQAGAMVGHRFVFRMSGRRKDARDPFGVMAFKVFLSLQFVVFSRILFRSSSMENAEAVVTRITESANRLWTHVFGGGLTDDALAPAISTLQISTALWLVVIFTFLVHFLPRKYFTSFETFFIRLPAPAQGLAIGLALGLLSLAASAESVPYIYFQF